MTSVMTAGTPIPEQLGRLDSPRLRAYRENLAFYRGQQWAGQARRRERRLVFNYAKALVEKTTSYLMSGVAFVVDEADAARSDREPFDKLRTQPLDGLRAQQAVRTEQVLRAVY